MSRSIRATVVAATALSAGLLTTTAAQAARPEPITFTGMAFYSQASHNVVDTATGPDGATYLAINLEGGDFYWGPSGNYHGGTDAVVAKIPAGQSTFEWATTVGGTGADDIGAIAVGPDGDVVIVGNTAAADFPTTPGALRSMAGGIDGFVVRLDGDTGAVDWSTLLGGSSRDLMFDVAVDRQDRIWVGGTTRSADYPGGRPIVGDGDAALTVLTPAGGLLSSTVFGGNADDRVDQIAFAPGGDVLTSGFVNGWPGSAPVYAIGQLGTEESPILRWGGPASKPAVERVTTVRGLGNGLSTMAVGRDGSLLLAGSTQSPDVPLKNPVQSAPGASGSGFVLKVAPNGKKLVWGTYYGGSGWIDPNAIVGDAWGATYVAGKSGATDGQQLHAVQDGQGGQWDGFVAKFTSTGRLAFSTYLIGGTESDGVQGIRLDKTGVGVFGDTWSKAVPGVAEEMPGFGAAIIVGQLAEVAHVTGLKGPARTADRTPTFRFEVDLAGSRAQCKVDKGAWRACSTTGFTTSALKPGRHTVQVRALSGPGRVAPVATKKFSVR